MLAQSFSSMDPDVGWRIPVVQVALKLPAHIALRVLGLASHTEAMAPHLAGTLSIKREAPKLKIHAHNSHARASSTEACSTNFQVIPQQANIEIEVPLNPSQIPDQPLWSKTKTATSSTRKASWPDALTSTPVEWPPRV